MEVTHYSSNSSSMSDSVVELTTSLLQASKGFRSTGRSGLNSHQKYKYATIDEIYGAVQESLTENGIRIVHFCEILQLGETLNEILITRLIHARTNQWIEDKRLLRPDKEGQQAKGSAQTYMRKYAVLALCALCPEDDDGEGANSYRMISREDCDLIDRALSTCENGSELRSNILRFNNINNLYELSQDKLESVKNYIKSNRKKKDV